MMNMPQATSLSERELITNLLNSYFIVDYGYINKVNSDDTVDVTHSAKQVLLDGTKLPETITKKVEVLTISGAGFSVKWDYKAGDKVLLLGLKDYVPYVDDVTQATVPKSFIHYDRATIKALPLCIFSDEAKVTITVEDGTMNIEAESDVVIIAKNVKVACDKMTVSKSENGSAALEVTP